MKDFKKNWLEIVSTIVIFIFSFILSNSLKGVFSSPSFRIGEILGKAIVYSLVTLIFANFLRKRWKKTKLEFWVFCLAIFFSTFSIVEIIKNKKQVSQVKNFVYEIEDISTNGQKKLKVNEKGSSSNNFSEQKFGKFNKILPIYHDLANTFEKMAEKITEESKEIAIILSPAFLTEKQNLAKAQNFMKSYKKNINDYEKNCLEHFDFLEIKIKELYPGQSVFDQSIRRGFDKSKIENTKMLNEYFSLITKSINTIDNIVNFLVEKKDEFFVSGIQLVFRDPLDAQHYNNLIQKLMENAKEEKKVMQNFENYKKRITEEFKNLLPK